MFLLTLTVLGFFATTTVGQQLTTKCFNSDWTQHYQKCYLPVNYTMDWWGAKGYCEKYGAKLGEPRGYVLADVLSAEMAARAPGAPSHWIGYHRNIPGSDNLPPFSAYWSDGQTANVTEVVWGQGQPDVLAGDCGYINHADMRGYMGPCDMPMPFLCEMDPCPAGDRDTFMCNGRCLGPSLACDSNGNDDCGNNYDEQNCSNRCSSTLQGASGFITPQTSGGVYLPNQECTWLIHTAPGLRVKIEVEFLNLELNTDFLEIYDGGLSWSTSSLGVRLTGDMTSYMYKSSLNFVFIRFVSDGSTQDQGFRISWTTMYACEYTRQTGYRFSNTEIQYDDLELTSLLDYTKCETECDENSNCLGFSYDNDTRHCYFMNQLPIPVPDSRFIIFSKTCPQNRPIQGLVPVMWNSMLTATDSYQQLATPLYPSFYIGNTVLEYLITASANNRITVEVLVVELCCEDTVTFHDGSRALLYTLNSGSLPSTVISTSNTLLVRMNLQAHWKCIGVLMKYIQGCSKTMTESGQLWTPGYGSAVGYGPLTRCTWTLNATTSDRSVTLVFSDFGLHESDFVMLTYSNGTVTTHTNEDLHGQSVTSTSPLVVAFQSSSRDSGRGFTASFSPGCSPLDETKYQIDSGSNNYGDVLTFQCASGYYFTDTRYAGQTSVSMRCELGGTYSIDPVPFCQRAYCGPAPLLPNSVIVTSSGSQGGDVLQYACVAGYTLTGTDIIRCLANGSWEMLPACTAVDCPSLDFLVITSPLPAAVLYGSGTDYNSVARVACPDYTQVIGAATVSCANGTWGFPDYAEPTFCRAIPCGTPVIDRAFISPGPPYITNQTLTATCQRGYDLIGNATFRCGVDTVLPACVEKTCSLDVLDDAVVPVDVSEIRSTFKYGEKVEVACSNGGLRLFGVNSTSIITECLENGNWSYAPVCQNASCGELYHVVGSVYTPEVPCTDYGCSFEFTCLPQYELVGESDYEDIPGQGDNIVRCGVINASLWDYGDLRCIGGQCIDPGYIASGFQIAGSYEIGAVVTFGCSRSGFSPLNTDGSNNTGIECVLLENGTLTWVGEMPTCVDVDQPVFDNCPTDPVSIGALEAPGFIVPSERDNDAISVLSISPPNFDPNIPRLDAVQVTYTASDFSGLSGTCNFFILVPDVIICRNEMTTQMTLGSEGAIIDGSDFVIVKNSDPDINLTYEPPSVPVEGTAASLEGIFEIDVTATSSSTGDVLDECTLQFQFEAENPCASWTFEVPNGIGNCNGGSCNPMCNDGFYFMEDPNAVSITVPCFLDGSGWSRDPPVCAHASSNHLVYSARYNFKYFIANGVNNFAECYDIYDEEISARLTTFASQMQDRCNENSSGNDAIVTYIDTENLNYSLATLRLEVLFEFRINLTDESADNSLALKDQCAGIIQNAFSSPSANNFAINDLTGEPAQGCNSGTYDYPSNSASFAYECVKNRRYANVNGSRICLDCPVGYFYDATAQNCLKCAVNTYRSDAGNGEECLPCPDGTGPDKTGLTDVSQCDLKAKCEKGHFSEDGLEPCKLCPKSFYNLGPMSTTCSKCNHDQVTVYEGSTSQDDCLNLTEVNEMKDAGLLDGVDTPCDPNPCLNGANCTYAYNTYHCNCAEGHTGRICDQPFTACTSNPCENEQQCVLLDNGGFYCNCDQSELSGDRCEVDEDGCSPTFCFNNGTCHNRKGGYSCKCPSFLGYTNKETGDCNTAIDQCTVNPCDHGTCVTHGSFYRSCACYPGFTGLDCSIDMDDCDPNLCMNGATCVDGVNNFTCDCADGYHGDFCQFIKQCDRACGESIDTNCNTCDENGTFNCINIGNSYTCDCNTNYVGISCEIELSPCNSYPCQHDGTCVKVTDTDFTCLCREPWEGDLCETEKDNCQPGTKCLNGGTCFSSATGHVCSCPSTHIGSNCSEMYDVCDRANPCGSPGSNCSFANGSFACSCEEGFTGDSCQTEEPSCTDIICNNGGTCDDTGGSPVCDCPAGYEGPSCDTDTDECASNTCPDDQECMDGLNSFSCICPVNKWGENCDKDVVIGGFDYIIAPRSLCRIDASGVSFGNGQTNIEAITISVWVRYKVLHGSGDILNVYATTENVDLIPQTPTVKMTFNSTHLRAVYTESTRRRKKRQTTNTETDISFRNNIADGYWWHILVTWNSQSGELTLYMNGNFVDQERFAEDNPLGTRGFAVLGHFDERSGTSDVANSFEGKISQLHMVNEVVTTADREQMYARTWPVSNLLLYPQRTTMLYHTIDYSSELEPGNLRCLSRTEDCDLNTVPSLPEFTTCPGDALSVGDRNTAPTWLAPTVNTSATYISTLSSGTALEAGLHGVVYATFDSQNSAGVCAFRVFYREEVCTPSEGTANCDINDGVHRCEMNCDDSQGWPGVFPLYLTCSMYGMWDEAVKASGYIEPRCAAATSLTNDVTVEVLVMTTGAACEAIKSDYINSVSTKLNNFNGQVGNGLCSSGCVVTNTSVTCLDNSTARVSLNFGLVSATVTYENSAIRVEEALQIMSGDAEVFAFASTSDDTQTVEPDIPSLDIRSTAECAPQYQISGDSCVMCGAGTFYDVSTSTCIRCPKGTYKDNLMSNCTACHSSSTTATDGATSSNFCKTSCILGQYYDDTDLQDCRDCPVGYYQDTRGEFSCKSCPLSFTTAGTRSTSSSSCISAASVTTTVTPGPPGPNTGASTEDDSGLGTGVIVAIVLGVIIGLLIIILVLVFCCCKGAMPCLSKKKPVVSPVGKEGYYANKYGELDMRFVNYNLKDVREKKGRPMDKEPIYEPPLSDDTGSLKTDISIHVPVFNEKMNGSITKKSLYMSNGSQNLNASLTRSLRSSARDPVSSRDQITPHIIAPMTSSPRSMHQYQYDNEEEVEHHRRKSRSKRRKRKTHKHRSSGYHDNREDADYENLDVGHQSLPKALSPLPQKVKSKPPEDVFMRPASPMNRPRTEVLPSQYEDFLGHSPVRSPERSRSREERSSRPPKMPKVHRAEDLHSPNAIMKIEVESDEEDLR